MKRRDFLLTTTSGIVALSAAECNNIGSISTSKLGKTDVTVTKFGFGSHYFHLQPENKDQVEREKVIRAAYESGVTTFDIYNSENNYFQYEPMSRYLAPILNDVQISIAMRPEEGRTYEEEFFHTLKLFNREYFDMVRLRATNPGREEWNFWERLFELRDKGYIRAAGIAIHNVSDMDVVLNTFKDDMDFVYFPYNFYHNKWRTRRSIQDFDTVEQSLHESGIGIVAMKPLTGDWLTPTLKEAAKAINPDIVYTQACLKWVQNSSMNPHTIIVGMNHLDHFEENLPAFHNPKMTDEETALLEQLRDVAEKTSQRLLPDHYKFLNDWAPKRESNVNYKLV
ncbi:aldo/keto reductase [Candidatus Latescibacterota bacterium]